MRLLLVLLLVIIPIGPEYYFTPMSGFIVHNLWTISIILNTLLYNDYLFLYKVIGPLDPSLVTIYANSQFKPIKAVMVLGQLITANVDQ